MKRNLEKNYNPGLFEDRIYAAWEKAGAFTPQADRDKKPFTVIMPPPNITGQLHMGHALDHTLQDVLIRYKRMKGYAALWLPGSDHASIATEVKVAAALMEQEGKTKEEIGREEFLKRAWAWKEEYGGRITNQCRKLGDSCDWTRERFTMDEGCNRAVRHFFVQLYNKGIIYRGNRMINWCPDCGTTLSDAEVEHVDREGLYWYFRYPAAEEGGEDMIVATSRPETMFGDVAIAVNPEDERYKDRIGQKVILPLVGRVIPIIADPYPDPDKGTGAVKITPAHDPNDFEVGKRHDLEVIACIDLKAKMTEAAGKYAGMDRYECREAWVQDLTDAGYLVKTEKMVIPVGTCYRCGTVVEPMLSEQWFVRMKELAQPAIEAAKSGALTHVPERFEKTYLRWLEEIRDWCISRQLWWGHRIPVWYCEDCGEVIVSEEEPKTCPKCGFSSLHQDEDVLDTWFSSALWPFSTLGWPEKTEDLSYFFPTDVLVTAYDIIFFWVVRMVFSSCEAMGQAPFHHVYIHGLVRDEQGRKMSKSLGNGIDPLEVIRQYGADALRFMLATGITPGNDMRFSYDKLEAARNFANKLWNASRFVIMNIQADDGSFLPYTLPDLHALSAAGKSLKTEDLWMLSRLAEAVSYVDRSMDKFDLALAGQRVHDLIWNEFCDRYIEFIKKRLNGEDEEDKKIVRGMLVRVLGDGLKLLHPFMPFITEEIYSFLPGADKGFLISSAWPRYSAVKEEETLFSEAATAMERAMEAIRAVRNIRTEADAPRSRKLTAFILGGEDDLKQMRAAESYIADLAGLSAVQYISDPAAAPQDAMSAVVTGAQIFIPLKDLVDKDAERARLEKEKKTLTAEVARAKGKLSNPGFTAKAPEKLVQAERDKLSKYEEKLSMVEKRLSALQ